MLEKLKETNEENLKEKLKDETERLDDILYKKEDIYICLIDNYLEVKHERLEDIIITELPIFLKDDITEDFKETITEEINEEIKEIEEEVKEIQKALKNGNKYMYDKIGVDCNYYFIDYKSCLEEIKENVKWAETKQQINYVLDLIEEIEEEEEEK